MMLPLPTLLIPALLAAGPDLAGRVVTTAGAPAAGAHVLIDSAALREGTGTLAASSYPDCRKRTRADADGRFRIAGVDPALVFRVLAIGDGCRPGSAARVDPAQGPITVKLAPFDPAGVPPDRLLRGVVLDPGGRPLVGARVAARQFKTEAFEGFSPDIFEPEAVTDLGGEFALVSKSPIGFADLLVEGNGVAPRVVPGLRPGRNPQRIVTSRGATVLGRIVRDGRGVPGAAVGLVQVDRNSASFLGDETIGTDEDGRFRFNNVHAEDNYAVYGKLGGGITPIRKLRVGGDGTTADAGDLLVVPGSRIRGQVLLSDGKPIPPGTRVMVGRDQAWDTRTVALDPEGRFEVADLPPERYTLTVLLEGYHLSLKNRSVSPLTPWFMAGTIAQDIAGLKVLMEPGGL